MRRKITFVLPDFFAGGAQKVMLSLAGGLDRSRYDPRILVLNAAGPFSTHVPEGVLVTDLQKTSLRRALPALRRELRGDAPDIVMSVMGYLNLGVLLLKPALKPGTCFIVREANAVRPEGSNGLSLLARKLAYRQLYKRADRVVSPSELIADELAGSFGVTRSLISVLRNPVDVDALRAAASPLRRADGSMKHFVCVGRLSRQKAYDRLLETLADHDVDAHVTILGEGPERGALEARCRERGLESRVTLAGFDAAPWAHVAGADALLLPSRWEGLPNVALEGLALGTPVIAAPEAGGIGEIAALAPAGAVTLAKMGPDFAAAMLKAKPQAGRTVRPSLLPDQFHPRSINSAFAALLDECWAADNARP